MGPKVKQISGFLLLAQFVVAGCSQGNFSSQNANARKDKPPSANQDAVPDPNVTVPGTDVLNPNFEGLVPKPDYALCTKLPTQGYATSGACSSNEVMVMINDGVAGGRSCCPIGVGVLSQIPVEVNQPRSGSCLANEVSTGIRDMRTPLCTKIQTAALKLSPPTSAIYGTRGSAAELAALAVQYNKNDLCACPAGTVIIGGIPSPDNSCYTVRCAKIEKHP
jgi:hypothetical protein